MQQKPSAAAVAGIDRDQCGRRSNPPIATADHRGQLRRCQLRRRPSAMATSAPAALASALGGGGMGVPGSMKGRCNQADRRQATCATTAAKPEYDKKVVKGLDWLKEQSERRRLVGQRLSRSTMTAFALLAFSGHCETVDSPKYGKTLVARRSTYLVDFGRKNNGNLGKRRQPPLLRARHRHLRTVPRLTRSTKTRAPRPSQSPALRCATRSQSLSKARPKAAAGSTVMARTASVTSPSPDGISKRSRLPSSPAASSPASIRR